MLQVSKAKAAGVAAAATSENLNRALASSGISFAAVLPNPANIKTLPGRGASGVEFRELERK